MSRWTLNHFFAYRKRHQLSPRQAVWHRWLNRLGPTWRSAPARRVIQGLCLAVFLHSFFWVTWPYAAVFTPTLLADKEWLPVDLFLRLDPLVGLSTALAGRSWQSVMGWTLAIMAACILIPRAFCGYLCPLGTVIDLFDWAIGQRVKRWHLKAQRGAWMHSKYYLLGFVLLTSLLGVMTAGTVSAIPVLTRGLLLTGDRLQRWLLRPPGEFGPMHWTLWLSIALFLAVLALGLLGKRFWCRYVCPTGAVFSSFNWLRFSERKVTDACISCNKCVQICPFDAIKEDFTTRTPDCTLCQTCGGVCPTQAIQFVPRWTALPLKPENEPPVLARPASRRAFIGTAVAGVAVGSAKALGALHKVTPADLGLAALAGPVPYSNEQPLRPPGSVSEPQFLELCIRCGECFRVCPGPVLHPAGLEHGLDHLWTPVAIPERAGCHAECNFCTQVCPTGAIQPLTLPEKRVTKMGLAVVEPATCLPFTGERACQLCVDECTAAGYDAIRLVPHHLSIKPEDLPPEGLYSAEELAAAAQIMVPEIVLEACVGCGLCEYRCYSHWGKAEGLLDRSAIRVLPAGAARPRV